jgi:hypothetical protein
MAKTSIETNQNCGKEKSRLTGRSTRMPTQAMPSAFSWPVLVPYALRAPAPVNLGVRPQNLAP